MTYRLQVDPEILKRFPDYRVLIIYATGLHNGPSDDFGTTILRAAEVEQRHNFGEEKAASHPHIAAWRTVYGQMGVKPSKFLCSAEALLSRTLKGNDLPTINRIVDIYNAVSIRHVLPVGGEDWSKLASDLVLKPATGQEDFETMQEGQSVVTHPEPGEIVWADAAGVTCRLWNWRQGFRTRLTEDTTEAYFVLDSLAPYTLEQLQAAGDELMGYLKETSPDCVLEHEVVGGQA